MSVSPLAIQQEANTAIETFRAVLVSQKPPIKLRAAIGNYIKVEGHHVNYKKFGFQTFEDFLLASGKFILKNVQGETIISIKPSEKTQHISQMVSRQKSSKKKASTYRHPHKSDQSWNKSSFSSNVYRNMSSSSVKGRNTLHQRTMNTNIRTKSDNNNNQTNRNDNFQQSQSNLNRNDTKMNNQQFNTQRPPQQQLRNPLIQNIPSKNQQQVNDKIIAKVQQQPLTFRIQQNVPSQSNLQFEQQQQAQNAQLQLQRQLNNKQLTARPILGQNNCNNLYNNETLPKQIINAKINVPNNYGTKSSVIKHNETNTNVTTIPLVRKTSIQDRLKIKISNENATASDTILLKDSPSPTTTGSTNYNKFPTTTTNLNDAVINNETKKTNSIVSPTAFQFNLNSDPVISLAQYCESQGFAAPEYKFLKLPLNRKVCRVLINGIIYSTYPDDFDNENAAKLACASKAIEQIKIEQSKNRYPICMDSDCELAMKFYQELINHPHGIFAKNASDWFQKTFEQTLPDHWWTIIENSHQFLIETIAGDNTIIYANTNLTESSATSSASSELEFVMQQITLPWEDKYWNLYITHCTSTIEVWARIVGSDYSAQLDNLLNDIDIYMLTDKTRPISISCGQIYLVCITECWHRIRVDEMNRSDGKCLCFFIDFGDEDWLPVDQLYICEMKFLKLAPQAIPFSLFGLEDFAENPNAKRHLDNLLIAKSLVGEIITKERDHELNSKIQVVLYDTSSNEDVNLNPMILKEICDDTPPPELKRTGVNNAIITYVNDSGEIFLQVKSSELLYVQKLIHQLVESKFKEDQHKVTLNDINRSNLYLVRDVDEHRWCRGALSSSELKLESEELDIFYVDYGMTKRLHISNIFRLDSLSAALSKFPRQAIKAKLHNIPPVTPNILARIRGLLPPDSPTIIKIGAIAIVPYVIVYKHMKEEDIFNVNETIRIEHELENSTDVVDISPLGHKSASSSPIPSRTNSITELASSLRNVAVKSPLALPNSPQKCDLPKLKTFEDIPEIGQYFPVYVTMSSNPFNFTLQPYNGVPKLVELMNELQEYCTTNTELIPIDMIEVGEAYAALNADGYYHRVTVENIFNSIMVHVVFCDFGDIAVLHNDKLKTLPAKFRSLPKQAIQARMHGIRPKHVDWTLEDCLRFRELTVGKKFVSKIKNITKDEVIENKRVLELSLIDTQTDDDIYIHKILVDEGRADLITER